MIEIALTISCKCGRKILPTVQQCSYCDDLDDRASRRKEMLQTQRALNKAPRVKPQELELRRIAEFFARSLNVTTDSRSRGVHNRRLNCAPMKPEEAGFTQEVLGGYIYDLSLFDFAKPAHGWSWESRWVDTTDIIRTMWPHLTIEKQLYFIDRNLDP